MRRAGHGDVVDIRQIGEFCAQFYAGDAEDTAAAADVYHRVARFQILLQQFEAHGGRFVLARAERHVGIEQHDDLARRGVVLYPFGTDDHALPYVQGTEMLFPHVYPVIPLDLAAGKFQRTERNKALAALFEQFEIGADAADVLLRDIQREIAFDENVLAFLRQVVVHVIPEGALVPLQGDDVVHVADGNAVIGIIPEDIGDQLAALRRRMGGQFDEFHSLFSSVPACTASSSAASAASSARSACFPSLRERNCFSVRMTLFSNQFGLRFIPM